MSKSMTWGKWAKATLDRTGREQLRALFFFASDPRNVAGRCFFHFAGPPATGKTTAAEVLARYLGESSVERIHPHQLGREVQGKGFERKLILAEDVSNRLRDWRKLGHLAQREIFNEWRLPPETFTVGRLPVPGILLVISEGRRKEVGSLLGLKERRIDFRRVIDGKQMRPNVAEELAADPGAISRWIHSAEDWVTDATQLGKPMEEKGGC